MVDLSLIATSGITQNLITIYLRAQKTSEIPAITKDRSIQHLLLLRKDISRVSYKDETSHVISL